MTPHSWVDSFSCDSDFWFCSQCYGISLDQPKIDTPAIIHGKFFQCCQDAINFLDGIELIETILEQ